MCNNPTTLPDGTIVACRSCDICTDNLTNDWVGRCLAESRTSVGTHSVTLTYGRDKDGVDRHERTSVLTYSDIQIWLKRLRNHGYPARYLVAGEYGTLKGRAHWHVIVFWQEKVMPVKMYQRYWDAHWEHGHQVWKRPEPSHVKYCCKYIRKDQKDTNAQSKFQFSKVPPIGAHYFINKAKEMVENGLVPRDRFYTFPEARRKKSRELIKFYLKGATWDLFMGAYCEAWEKKYPWKDFPPSEILHDWVGKHWHNRQMYVANPKNYKPVDQALLEEANRKEEYRKAHELYHFGKNRIGFFNADWTPDEQKEQVTQFGAYKQPDVLYPRSPVVARTGYNWPE